MPFLESMSKCNLVCYCLLVYISLHISLRQGNHSVNNSCDMPVVLSHDSSNRGTKRIPTLHTCIYRLLISLLVLSFPLQSLAVSEVTLASAAPIIIQEGEQVSIAYTVRLSFRQKYTRAQLFCITSMGVSLDLRAPNNYYPKILSSRRAV